jgi:hypothetical protein
MADIRLKYGTQTTITLSLASLADDNTNALVGRASTAVVNTNNDVDHLVSGDIRTGTSPTAARTIEIWAYAQIDDTPTYPDGITGTDAAKTFTSDGVKQSALRFLHAIVIEAASDRDYFMPPTSIAQAFGGVLPKRWGLFVVNRTGVALHATGGNHVFSYMPVQFQTV